MGVVQVLIWLGLAMQGMAGQPARLHVVITDGQGAAVAGATVTVKNDATGLQRAAASNERGEAHFDLLPAGQYTVVAQYASFGILTRRLSLPAGTSSVVSGRLIDEKAERRAAIYEQWYDQPDDATKKLTELQLHAASASGVVSVRGSAR